MRKAQDITAQAQQAADAIKAEASRVADSLHRNAQASASEAYTNAKKQGWERGCWDAAKHAVAAKKQAIREGHAEGQLAGYCEVAREFGLRVPETVTQIPAGQELNVDLDRVYPNVYAATDGWIVRLILGNTQCVQKFQYPVTRPTVYQKSVTLLRAIRYRDEMTPPTVSHYQHLYEECLQQALLDLHGAAAQLRACELFHIRVQYSALQLDRVAFVGTDPSDRLHAPDLEILTQPWPNLFGKPPERIYKAFANLGLDSRRTVRDLLLLTGDDLLEAGGFGAVSLRKLRDGLSDYGLALWGDPAPAPPTTTAARDDAGREFRAINLD